WNHLEGNRDLARSRKGLLFESDEGAQKTSFAKIFKYCVRIRLKLFDGYRVSGIEQVKAKQQLLLRNLHILCRNDLYRYAFSLSLEPYRKIQADGAVRTAFRCNFD